MNASSARDGPPPGGPITLEIANRLDEIERVENVVIVLAVESGSRAWGFASPDSDFDVRFVYVRPVRDYLGIRSRRTRDVIERPILDAIDLSGWDLGKALGLLAKSNPSLHEWLRSPIVYREHPWIAPRLRELQAGFWSPSAGLHHYLSMAAANRDAYLGGPSVRYKKYLYVLRPLLAARWISEGRGPVPMEFEHLVEATLDDEGLRSEIEDLLAAKRSMPEMGEGPPSEALDAFISAEMSRFDRLPRSPRKRGPEAGPLDEFFLESLRRLWGDRLPGA